MCGIQVGTVVRSTNGRDKGMYFIVIATEEKYVFLVDGSLRKIENAKKKKMKHVEITPMFSDVIAQRVANKNKISNQDVKKALKEVLREI